MLQSIHTVDDHQFKDEDLETVGELSKVCSRQTRNLRFFSYLACADVECKMTGTHLIRIVTCRSQ